MKQIYINVFDVNKHQFIPKELYLKGNHWEDLKDNSRASSKLYLSPGFIDSHAHVFPGTDVGISADIIGLRTGVHLIIDAGSAGSTNYSCFRDYVIPTFKTKVKAFLNISRIGLITKQPYFDQRNLDVQSAVNCIQKDQDGLLLGIKVLSSGTVVENCGILPMQKAVEAAELAGCRIMAHMTVGPPTNEENMAYLRKGDIITHCFHGAQNTPAALVASRGMPINPAYFSVPNIMWNDDGTPTKPLSDAIDRGVFLDVGHGASSFSQSVARAVIQAGIREFSISSDAHIRNIDNVVRSLPHVMSKFFSLGMTIEEVTAAVTIIPARLLGITGWCDDLSKHSTFFRIRPVDKNDPPFFDSYREPMDVQQLIEPVAVVTNGEVTPLISCWESLA